MDFCLDPRVTKPCYQYIYIYYDENDVLGILLLLFEGKTARLLTH